MRVTLTVRCYVTSTFSNVSLALVRPQPLDLNDYHADIFAVHHRSSFLDYTHLMYGILFNLSYFYTLDFHRIACHDAHAV